MHTKTPPRFRYKNFGKKDTLQNVSFYFIYTKDKSHEYIYSTLFFLEFTLVSIEKKDASARASFLFFFILKHLKGRLKHLLNLETILIHLLPHRIGARFSCVVAPWRAIVKIEKKKVFQLHNVLFLLGFLFYVPFCLFLFFGSNLDAAPKGAVFLPKTKLSL
jgi:hypothetical protein